MKMHKCYTFFLLKSSSASILFKLLISFRNPNKIKASHLTCNGVEIHLSFSLSLLGAKLAKTAGTGSYFRIVSV